MNRKSSKTNRRWVQASLGLLLPLALGLEVQAAEPEPSDFTLDPIVVTAQRQETRELDTPATTTVISRAEIAKSGATTVYELLDRQIGFASMSYGPAGREYGLSSGRTIVRGLDKGTLVMVNGAPLNLLNYNGTENIPLENVERIEIIKGASSTLYGTEALAGVVNIITKKAGGEMKTTVTTGGGNYGKQWSVNQQADGVNIYLGREYLGAVQQTSRIFPELKTQKYYWYLNSGTKDSAFVSAALNDKLQFSWMYADVISSRGQSPLNGGNDNTVYEYEDVRHSLNWTYDDKPSGIKAVAFYNLRDLDGTSGKLGKPQILSSSANLKMDNYGLDAQKTWKLAGSQDVLVGGMSWMQENYKNKMDDSKAAGRTSLSLYNSYTHQFTPRVSSTLGLRGQWVHDYAKDEQVFVPQWQALYKMDEHASWYVNIGKSFQMPPLNQYFEKPNTQFAALKPQQGWTYETGVKWIDGDDAWKLALYHMDIKDKFYWDKNVATNESYLTNKGDFRNSGVEVEYRKILNDSWQYQLGASLSNPEVNDSGKWVQDSSRVQFTAGVEYHKEKWLTQLNYLFIGDREDSYYLKNEATPDRHQLNAVIRYAAAKNDTITLQLNNILNRDNAINKYENWDLPFHWTLVMQHTF